MLVPKCSDLKENDGNCNWIIELQRKEAIDTKKDALFFLPCGIRPVKDVLYLVDAFEKLSEICERDLGHRCYLVIVGPILDYEYSFQVFEKLSKLALSLS